MGAEDLIGQVLHDTYRIDELIGRGGSGEVYAASHLRIERRFAVKVLLPGAVTDDDAMARFEREARVTSAIGNPHIVEVVDCYRTEDGRPYLVMELLEGEDLAAYCQRSGRLEPFEVGAILQQAANGLEAAHLQGVIHRDLKPQNLFLCESERGHRLVKLLDFGTSKILGNPREKSQHALLGTPHYMAPEQAASRSGSITARTDVYALGVILFEVLAGELPFKSTALFSLLYEIVKRDAPSLKQYRPDLPDDICRVVAKAMRKDATQRHASVAALSRHFSAAVMRSDEADQEQTYTWDAFYELATRGGSVVDDLSARARRNPSDEVTARTRAPTRDASDAVRDAATTEPLTKAAHAAVHMLTGAAAPQGPTRIVRQAMVAPLVPPPATESAPDLTGELEDTDSITDRDAHNPSVSSGIIERATPPVQPAFDPVTVTPPIEPVTPVAEDEHSATPTPPLPQSLPATEPPVPLAADRAAVRPLPPPGEASAVSALFGSLTQPGEGGSSVSGVFGEPSQTGVDVESSPTLAWGGQTPPRPLPDLQLTPAPTEVVEPIPDVVVDEGLPRYVAPLITIALIAALILFGAALWAVCGLQG